MTSHGLDSFQLRDKRYDQVVHMVTAANGAEQFYQSSNNPTRWEGLQLAREQDSKAAEVGNTFLNLIPIPRSCLCPIPRPPSRLCPIPRPPPCLCPIPRPPTTSLSHSQIPILSVPLIHFFPFVHGGHGRRKEGREEGGGRGEKREGREEGEEKGRRRDGKGREEGVGRRMREEKSPCEA